MMNKHFGVIVMVLWSLLYATSCEKMVINGADSPDAADANVVVQVMSYEQQPFPVASTRGDVETACTRLNFIVFNEAGERVRQETQLLGDEATTASPTTCASGPLPAPVEPCRTCILPPSSVILPGLLSLRGRLGEW